MQLAVVREVGAELQEERPEVGIDAVEVEVVDHAGAAHDPRVGDTIGVAAFLGAEHRRLLPRPADEHHTLLRGERAEHRRHDVVLALTLLEIHPRDTLVLGEAVHRRGEPVSDLRQRRGRGDRQAQPLMHIPDQPRRVLQPGLIHIQVHPVDALHFEVPVNQHVIAAGPREGQEFRADALIAALPAHAWRRRSAGKGAKGDRLYDWARTPIHGINFPQSSYWLLARRSISDPTDLAYYLCHAPARTGLTELVTVAGTRWAIEETFQTSKGQTGLDHYQVRQYTGWYRHITLSMLAHAFLTVTRSKKGAPNQATTPSSP